ncbi:unnamed protein product, partial [Porites lobata]
KIGQTVALSLILVVSLVGNSLIVLIVYKTPTLRKPINMLIANMAMSDLLYPIFFVPARLAEWHAGSWLIGGTLGQALCKIHIFLVDVSSLVSIQSLVLITVDRFVAVVVPPVPSLHPGEQSANAEQQRTRRNRNVLKMAITIVVVFFICW